MGETGRFMKIERGSLRLDHPDWNPSQCTVRMNDDGDRLAALSRALLQSDHRPVMRVKTVVDCDFGFLLKVGTMSPTSNRYPVRISPSASGRASECSRHPRRCI